MQIGEENAVRNVGSEGAFNDMNITFIKLRVKIFNKPYFCREIIPNSTATKLSTRNITL
jgi:hypothetical protein